VIDPVTKYSLGGHRSFEFPVLDFLQRPGLPIVERYVHSYLDLNVAEKEFVNAILNTKSKEILDILPYKPLKSGSEFPSLFDWAIENDKEFVVKYYIDKNKTKIKQEYFDEEIHNKAWTVAKYIFENLHFQTSENLKKIEDKKYKKIWNERIANQGL